MQTRKPLLIVVGCVALILVLCLVSVLLWSPADQPDASDAGGDPAPEQTTTTTADAATTTTGTATASADGVTTQTDAADSATNGDAPQTGTTAQTAAVPHQDPTAVTTTTTTTKTTTATTKEAIRLPGVPLD